MCRVFVKSGIDKQIYENTFSKFLKLTFLEFCHMNLAYFQKVFLLYLLLLEMQQLTSAIIRVTLTHVRHNSPIFRHLLQNFRKPGSFIFLIHHYYMSLVFDQNILLYQFVSHHHMIIKFRSIDLLKGFVIHRCA